MHVWRPLLPQMVQKKNDISDPLTEIVKIASTFGNKGFADKQVEDIEDLLQEQSLNEEELAELIDESTFNAFVEENTNNKFV